MPFQKHPSFNAPSDRDAVIWRYIDFAKFLSLLENEALFFARATRMRQQDPFEAHIPDWQLQRAAMITVSQFKKENPTIDQKIFYEQNYESLRALNSEKIKGSFLLNCWHLSIQESVAMWQIYAPRNNGLAIVSTYTRLCQSFELSAPPIYVGKVSYKDLRSDFHNLGNLFNAVLVKRPAFSWEQEIRAVVSAQEKRLGSHGPEGPTPQEIILDASEAGWNAKVNLDILIDHIRVPPACADWLVDVVKSTVRKFGLEKNVVRSDLDDFDEWRPGLPY